jgi:hypothetical protein
MKMKAARTKTLIYQHAPNEAFWEGFIDYQHGQHRNPYDDLQNALGEAQAWGSGQEAAQRGRQSGR